MTRSTGKSICLLDKKGEPLPPCKEHLGRPLLFVRYDLLGFFGVGWANDEAEADKLAREALQAKLEGRAIELREQAAQLEAASRCKEEGMTDLEFVHVSKLPERPTNTSWGPWSLKADHLVLLEGQREVYAIPLDRLGEPDWIVHVVQKDWDVKVVGHFARALVELRHRG